jgi:hypothetical protein
VNEIMGTLYFRIPPTHKISVYPRFIF